MAKKSRFFACDCAEAVLGITSQKKAAVTLLNCKCRDVESSKKYSIQSIVANVKKAKLLP